MARNPLARRLESALEKLRRENPDGPIATYAWMWRVLVRSDPSRLSLLARFAWLVAVDAVLLGAWAVFRPIRSLLHRPSSRFALTASVAAVGLLTIFLTRPAVHPPAPWSGTPTIDIQSNGVMRFEGQFVTDEEIRHLVDHYGVKVASVRIDEAATVSRVDEAARPLSDAGIERIIAESVPPRASGEF